VFIEALEDLLDKIQNVTKIAKNNKISFSAEPSKEYIEAVDQVCKSEYFKKQFTKYELRRKKALMFTIISEVGMRSVVSKFRSDMDGIMIQNLPVEYPLITHKVHKSANKIQMTFDPETPLDEVTKYAKHVLELKNKPKKRKLSLGKSFRLLMIDDEVQESKEHYRGKYDYIEQITKKLFLEKYNEELTLDDTQKSLQRIRKIRKQINNS
jgi:hypothetical protein